MSDEFDLIGLIREGLNVQAIDSRVILGIGDDAAVLRPADGHDLVTSTDTLVVGVHFDEGIHAEHLGHKSLAVNLSDLAAMGAAPRWALLSLTLPSADAGWVRAFVDGLIPLCRQHQVSIVGGDTTAGPLSVTIQVIGELPSGTGLRRSGARPGDRLAVTGTLGDAALARHLGETTAGDELMGRLFRPTPRIHCGLALRDLATSCIDLSDGLVADCGHLARASGVALTIDVDQVPLSKAFMARSVDDQRKELFLTGGDDYELCFTYALDRAAAVAQASIATGVAFTTIGVVTDGEGVMVVRGDQPIPIDRTGYCHFD